MKIQRVEIFRNAIYSILSNGFSFLVSSLIVLIFPKLLGIEAYGYLQLYLFYSTYIGLLHFGLIDGVYLKYGGAVYEKLDKELFFSQIAFVFLLQLMISVIVFYMSREYFDDINKMTVFMYLCIEIIIINTRGFFLYVLQATNRIKRYAKVIAFERIFFVVIVILQILFFSIKSYGEIIVIDLAGKTVSLFVACYYCKRLLYGKFVGRKMLFRELRENILAGSNLMFSNISNTLIIGISRFLIERNWGVTVFGKVSLILSVSGMMVVFINALSIVIYPLIRRVDSIQLKQIYITVRDLLGSILLSLLLLYYPLFFLVHLWLPEYRNILIYSSLIYPVFIFEGRMSLLINTYMKALRKEKLLLKINLVSMVLSCCLSIIAIYIYESISFSVFAITITVCVRYIIAEIILSKELGVQSNINVFLEQFMILYFILINYYLEFILFKFLFFFFVIILICKNIQNYCTSYAKLQSAK